MTDTDLTAAYMAGFEKGKATAEARIRELEEALGPFVAHESMLVDAPLVVTLCVTRDEYDRAARALKEGA